MDEITLLNRSFGQLRDFNSVGQHIVNKYTKTTDKPKDSTKTLSLDDLYNLGQALVGVFNKDISRRTTKCSGYGQHQPDPHEALPSA